MDARKPPQTAMILAAGLGKRMRPLTDTCPKPLIRIAGKPLIDWSLDLLAVAGVAKAIVNIHYLGDKLINHLEQRRNPEIVISDERDELLDSAGGIVKALPALGTGSFYILNADTFWIDRAGSSLIAMAEKWDASRMDMLLLLASFDRATGHSGSGDFIISRDGRLARSHGAPGGLIYAGAIIAHPRIFANAVVHPHSLNLYFDQAITAGRLYGTILDGQWITVGTPDAIAPAEAVIDAAAVLAK